MSRILVLIIVLLIVIPVQAQRAKLPVTIDTLRGEIAFADPDNPAELNPDLIWDTGMQPDNRYNLTEFPGKLVLISQPEDLLGASVCTVASGDFTTSVNVDIAPGLDGQGGGLFVRVPGTWDTYIGIARSKDGVEQSVGSWGLYDAGSPLASVNTHYTGSEAGFRIRREDGLLTIAFQAGPQRRWQEMRHNFEFTLPDEVEICVNLWSAGPSRSFSGVFDAFTVVMP